jgi:UDP-N-acetylmuramyl pentapeptide phosphotransferase/UDP-N-acetylglucosamine-1-phosphate transferase
MVWTISVAVAAVVFVASLAGTGLILRVLKSRAILDHPNPRSSHATPTPKGGGIAVVAVVAAAWLATTWKAGGVEAPLVIGLAIALAVVSWIDDLRGLGAPTRLAAHAAAVILALVLAPLPGPVFGGILPSTLDLIAAGLLWVWFINLFNFMDGIDGMAGLETVAIGIGVMLVSAAVGLAGHAAVQGLILAAAAAGFLCWNWHPAKIFLGDVGSVPLGFLLGWLLIDLAASDQRTAALILPLYYLADATLTLVNRAFRGEKVWQAHREHFYQKGVQRGLSHADVVRHVLWVDGVLVVLAVAAGGGWPWAALLGAVTAVLWLLFFLRGEGREPRP